MAIIIKNAEMTSKQYLSRAFWLRKKIAAKETHLEELRTQAEKSTQVLTGMPRGGNAQSSVETLAVMIADLSWEIELDELDLAHYEAEIKKVIDEVSDPLCFQVLTYRYLAFHTWTQISDEMHYSNRQLFRIHAKALRAVDDVIE